MTLRVLIVDDMATYRSIISRSLSQISNVEVVGKVSNGKKALEFLDNNPVDLITLDVEMPIMDGLATLKELRKRRDSADVVMLSGLSDQAASLTIKCLELGAIDFVLKPQTASFVENQNQLVERLTEITSTLDRKRKFSRRPTPRTTTKVVSKPTIKQTAAPVARSSSASRLTLSRPRIVLIGISTGGPKALAEVFEQLKGPLPFPILIVQHMPPKFTASLAENLNRKSNIEVVEASDGDVVQNNTAYIAPGGFHLYLLKEEDFGTVLATNTDPPVNSCRPAVDVLFQSAAGHYKSGEVLAIIMTGMGKDGADGCVALKKMGGYVVTQSEESCTIYGMPKSVEDLGIQDEVIDLKDIAPFIMRAAKAPAVALRRT